MRSRAACHDSKRAWKLAPSSWSSRTAAPVIVEALTAVLVRLRSESKLSIILVEQNSRVAFEFSDRSVVMDKGRIVYDGASKTLRERD